MKLKDLLAVIKTGTQILLKAGSYTINGKCFKVYNSVLDVKIGDYEVEFVGLSKNIIHIRASKEI